MCTSETHQFCRCVGRARLITGIMHNLHTEITKPDGSLNVMEQSESVDVVLQSLRLT